MSPRFETNPVLKKRLPPLVRWAVFSLVCLLLPAPQTNALAHAIDMYAQEQAIALKADGFVLDWKITPGPLLADSIWAAADRDHDGTVSQPEARTWLAPFLTDCVVTLDGQPLTLKVDSLYWPAQIDGFRTGDDSLRVQLHAPWPAKTDSAHHLQIHNAYLEGNSLNWFSISAADGLSFSTPQQSNGRLSLDVGTGLAFESWNSGQPDPTGMTSLLTGAGPESAVSVLVGLVKLPALSPLFLLGAFLLSLLLGSLHALTPGHGKTLVAAYLIGSRGRSRDAVFLGLVVTLTHTGSVVLLGLLTLLASQYILPGLIAPWLEILSGVLVVFFGLNLAFQRRQVLVEWWRKAFSRHRTERILLKSAKLSQPAAGFGLLRTPASEPHVHHHGPGGHTHLPAGDVTWKSLLALGISGGLVPCPDAIAILLVAVAINRIVFGMLLIVAFSVGLALVLILIGVALVHGARLASRNAHNDWLNRFSRYTPLVSALVVAALGVGLTVSAVNTLRFTSAVGRVVTAAETNLLYLLPDAQGKLQLTRQPLTPYPDSNRRSLTHEPDGLAGYVLSPDKTRIVYIVLDAQGRTTFHEIAANGTGARLLLDCQQAQCSAPTWYPDGHAYPSGQRLVYQRADYVDETSLPRFSLWWLDVASGETHPVFQDDAFASYAAAFSPDGQWLSYKSPANNTLQLYNLKDGRAISIPVPAQAGALQGWSPAGDALLFWDGDGLALQVTHYDLASGRKTSLGVPDQNDYAAVWSPDGNWIAIDREPAPSNLSSQRKRGDQVWLVRPDGSDTRLLLGEDDASYSDLRWSADGRWLVYTRYSYLAPGESELWRVDIVTGAMTRLVAGGMEPSLLP